MKSSTNTTFYRMPKSLPFGIGIICILAIALQLLMPEITTEVWLIKYVIPLCLPCIIVSLTWGVVIDRESIYCCFKFRSLTIWPHKIVKRSAIESVQKTARGGYAIFSKRADGISDQVLILPRNMIDLNSAVASLMEEQKSSRGE